MWRAIARRSQSGCELYGDAMQTPRRVQFASGPTEEDTLESSTTNGPALTFRKSIQASTVIETKTKSLDPEVYWAHEVAWQRLTQASNYANQAGFAFVINAANNRWGGRHPPHTTHENGF